MDGESGAEILAFRGSGDELETENETVSASAARAKRRPGRPQGSKNKVPKAVKEAILEADPVNHLIRVMKGQKFMRAVDEGGKRRIAVYPTLVESNRAAETLLRKVAADLKAVEVDARNENTNTHAFTTPEDREQAAAEWRALLGDFRAPAPPAGERAAFKAALESPGPEPPKVGDKIDAGFGITAILTEFTEHNSPVWRAERGGKFLKVVYGAPDRVRGWAEALADEEGWA